MQQFPSKEYEHAMPPMVPNMPANKSSGEKYIVIDIMCVAVFSRSSFVSSKMGAVSRCVEDPEMHMRLDAGH